MAFDREFLKNSTTTANREDAAPVPGRTSLAEHETASDPHASENGATLAHLSSAGSQPTAQAASADHDEDGADHDAHDVSEDASPPADAPEVVGTGTGRRRATARAAQAPTEQPADPAAAQAAPQAPAEDPHGGPFERTLPHKKKYFARTDEYNRKRIEDNPVRNGNHVSRPGVRVGSKKKGKDLFKLATPTAMRYLIVFENGKYVGKPYDEVIGKDLSSVSFKYLVAKAKREGKPPPPPPTTNSRLLLNPAKPRKIWIDGAERWCVLSWYGIQSSAWIRVDQLKVPGMSVAKSDDAILKAARKGAKKDRPKRPPLSNLAHFQFRAAADPVGRSDTLDMTRKLGPNTGGGGNAVSHYLGHDTPTSYTQADGTVHSESRFVYPISQSLPRPGAAVLALDTATPEDHFFVPSGPDFHREVGVYALNAKKSNVRQTWVYGFLGKNVNGVWQPDTTRYGWVPLRTIKATP
jgi:hypothetical protein